VVNALLIKKKTYLIVNRSDNRGGFLLEREMKCPFIRTTIIRDIPQDTIYRTHTFEHHDGTEETFCAYSTPIFQIQTDVMSDCVGEKCAAFQDGRCI